MKQFSYLLFDLGGVIVDWNGIEPLRALTGHRLSAEDARRFWLESKAVKAFETGRCDAERFARDAMAELGVKMEARQFIDLFASWERGPFPGAPELLRSLAPRHRLACLSNNNPIHWEMHRRAGVLDCFQRLFASFQTGLVKPEPEVFLHVIRSLGVAPETILFFDDTPECVAGAAHLGLTARLAREPAGVQTALRDFGIAVP